MDPWSIAASAAIIAALCDMILVCSAKFVEATGNVDDILNGFNREVSTVSSVLGSIGSTFEARPPQMPFERTLSKGGSVFDTNPDSNNNLPLSVLSTLINTIHKTVEEEIKAGEFTRAEHSQLRAIELAGKRGRDLIFSSKIRVEMQQKLATIYVHQRKLEPAKRIWKTLPKQEERTLPKRMAILYQLYHDLATIHEQRTIEYARKFAMRAYKGRLELSPNGDDHVFQSMDLLSQNL
ncbi:hypothetical protein MMC29_004219 [Sticta canariensis]|nr:hypothetical protein [Sticta canariensis]